MFANEQIDDQVLLKTDGFPTYHLANVVDDHLMGVTHVIRAEEWLNSTPKHMALYRAFGWQPPEWVHMPLLRNKDRSKISKRKNPTSVEFYRAAGILPEAMLNFLGRMGYSLPEDREKFSLQEMIDNFSWDRVSLGGPVFDIEKLEWLNGLYMRELAREEFLRRVQSTVLDPGYLARVAPLVQERMKTMSEFVPMTDYFFRLDLDYPIEMLIPHKRRNEEGIRDRVREGLSGVLEILEAKRVLEHADLEAVLRAFCEQKGWKAGDLFMAIRAAVTGRTATPPLFETMEVLGKARATYRLRRAIDRLSASGTGPTSSHS
jgi:glutamyl-tRNA synthetase